MALGVSAKHGSSAGPLKPLPTSYRAGADRRGRMSRIELSLPHPTAPLVVADSLRSPPRPRRPAPVIGERPDQCLPGRSWSVVVPSSNWRRIPLGTGDGRMLQLQSGGGAIQRISARGWPMPAKAGDFITNLRRSGSRVRRAPRTCPSVPRRVPRSCCSRRRGDHR